MKKIFALVLAFAVCLSLCACGDNEAADTDNGSDHGAEAGVDFEKMLLNGSVYWGRVNRDFPGLAFLSDGTIVDRQGTWQLDGHIVNCVWADGGTAAYEFKELDGVYYLVGDDAIMYSDLYIRPDTIPSKSVEITLDNWQEYFEFTQETKEIIDQFGESTGETEEYYLKLKPEYDRILVSRDSDILIRFRYGENGVETDARLRGWSIDYFGEHGIRNDAEHIFEMLKVQGTLHFIDGIE